MKVFATNILDFLKNESLSISVPLFQRPYSWDEWHCEVFWQDIMRTGTTEKLHFFGAVFVRREQDRKGNPSLALIDGQQRTLTTLLLIAAFAEYLRQSSAVVEGSGGAVNAESLVESYLQLGTRSKVVTAERDEEAFKAALGTAPRGANKTHTSLPASRALTNKNLFARKMAEASFDAQVFWQGLRLFDIVLLELEPDDDAQAIFESFNSKGVPLVTADMVRNFLLLAESPEEQVRLYFAYWEHIQGLFGDDPGSLRLNNAIRAWTVIRCKTPHAKSDAEAFEDFKQYAQNEYSGSAEELMDELLSFCSVWAENYRYHAIKKFRSANWAKLGRKTLVSDRPLMPARDEVRAYYAKHFGVETRGERL